MLASELKLGPASGVFLSRNAAGRDAWVGLLIWPEVGGVVPGGRGGGMGGVRALESVALAGGGKSNLPRLLPPSFYRRLSHFGGTKPNRTSGRPSGRRRREGEDGG